VSMRRFLFGLLLLTLPVTLPLRAWNATGHRIVAAIAYDRLTPQAKARVDELLRQHPDFANLPSREAFLTASVWPDAIRNDPRFYDDTAANPKPTPLLAGFPSMARHTNWHYIDLPFSPDGTPLEQPKKPNALVELRRILKEPALTAYDLPWLIHLTGDVHQPLHCTSRFTKQLPHGDQGGNLVFVTPGRNLHSFWDGLAGADTSEEFVNRFATGATAELVRAKGPNPRLSRDPKRWIDEAFALAQHDVYTFGPASGSRENPITLPENYEAEARQIARVQLAKSGFRLAAVLNAKLGR
jgi:hypothetical protein